MIISKGTNILNKANCYKVILFTLLITSLVSPSAAETITGTPTELIDGSGSFTWTSQNFPALRDGDTLTLTVVNNTLAGLSSVVYSEEPIAIGLAYKMKKITFYEVLSENFPSANLKNIDDSQRVCIKYLNNYYSNGFRQYNGIVIDKNHYTVHVGDKISTIEITDIGMNNKGYYILFKPGNNVMYKGDLISVYDFYGDSFVGTGDSRILVYTKFDTELDSVDFQGFVEIYIDENIIPSEFGNLMICSQCNEDWRDYEMISNNGDITLTEGINDLSDELKIVKNGNSIYPSANIIKRTVNVNYIPAPIPEPTPEPITEPTPEPIIEPTPEPITEPTPEPIIELTPELIGEPTPEPITEPNKIERGPEESKEPFNETEEKQNQQEEKMSLKSIIDSMINWLKSIF